LCCTHEDSAYAKDNAEQRDIPSLPACKTHGSDHFRKKDAISETYPIVDIEAHKTDSKYDLCPVDRRIFLIDQVEALRRGSRKA
jgi:hypothetical protein